MAPDLHDKIQKSRHIVLSFDGTRRESGLGAAAWILWLRNEYGIFEKVSYGGCVLRNASAMIAEREALRKGTEHLTVLFPTVVSSFDFQVENSGRTVQYKHNAQSLRLFGLHSDVTDAHRAGANRLQNKNKRSCLSQLPESPSIRSTECPQCMVTTWVEWSISADVTREVKTSAKALTAWWKHCPRSTCCHKVTTSRWRPSRQCAHWCREVRRNKFGAHQSSCSR